MKYMIFPFDIRYIFLRDHIVMPMIFGTFKGEGKESKLIFFWPELQQRSEAVLKLTFSLSIHEAGLR